MAKSNDKKRNPPINPSSSAWRKVTVDQSEEERRDIIEYVQSQARDEKVIHLEKVKIEHINDRKLERWDVVTNSDRYWVITNPTNLYTQTDFPSLDATITFHVGITVRLIAKQSTLSPSQKSRICEPSWRICEKASLLLDQAEEAEDFQSVGMLCRESLLTLAKSTWQLVNWLTHSSNAFRFDGIVAVDATNLLVATFDTLFTRYERGTPEKCPICHSYQIVEQYRPDLDIDSPFVMGCKSCGWVDIEL
jgi:hypothetical protein